MFKLVQLILKSALLLAQREEKRQKVNQEKFKKRQQQVANDLRDEAERLRDQLEKVTNQQAIAQADSHIGNEGIYQAQHAAAAVVSRLAFISPAK